MKVRFLNESGFREAMFGLGLSHGVTSGSMKLGNEAMVHMKAVADRLAHLGRGHNEFLRQIVVWLDIIAPRYWWAEFDTYKVGTVAQSESTMHTILKDGLSDANFEHPVSDTFLDQLNWLVEGNDLVGLKAALPEGFLQRRVVSLDYAVLQELFAQRKGHRLPEWKVFMDEVRNSVMRPEWIENEIDLSEKSEAEHRQIPPCFMCGGEARRNSVHAWCKNNDCLTREENGFTIEVWNRLSAITASERRMREALKEASFWLNQACMSSGMPDDDDALHSAYHDAAMRASAALSEGWEAGMSAWRYIGHVCDFAHVCKAPCDHSKPHKPYVGDNPASSDCSRWFHCDVARAKVRCLPVEGEVNK